MIIRLAMPSGKRRMLWGAEMGREMKWPASMEVSDILAWKHKMLSGTKMGRELWRLVVFGV
jgi:hypothetical protein